MSTNLYGVAEIAAALGARPPTVAQWHRRGRLPQPDEVLAMGPVWYADTIRPWIDKERIRVQQFGIEKSEARKRLEAIGRSSQQLGSVTVDVLGGIGATIIVFLILLALATSISKPS